MIFVDTEPPTCGYCPTDITIDNATSTEIRVNWDRPVCTDNSGNPPIISSDRQSGALFPVPSSTEVVYVVSDGTNVNRNCSFRITIASEYQALTRENKGTEKDNHSVGWDMSIPLNLFFNFRRKRTSVSPEVRIA